MDNSKKLAALKVIRKVHQKELDRIDKEIRELEMPRFKITVSGIDCINKLCDEIEKIEKNYITDEQLMELAINSRHTLPELQRVVKKYGLTLNGLRLIIAAITEDPKSIEYYFDPIFHALNSHT